MTNSKNLNLTFKTLIPYIIFTIQLYALDLCVRAFDPFETYIQLYYFLPNLFTLSFASLFVGLVACLKNLSKKIVYSVICVIFSLLAIAQMITYFEVNAALSFQYISMGGEGASYILNSLIALITSRPIHFCVVLAVIFTIPINCILFDKQKVFKIKPLIIGVVLFIIINCCCLFFCNMLWPFNNQNEAEQTSSTSKAEIFKKFEDRYVCLKIGGLYEYTLRDLIPLGKVVDENITDEDRRFLETQYSPEPNTPNTQTGIFKGKNVIFLQLEGFDTVLLDENHTPNLMALKNNSIDFVNHFSLAAGIGSTINNETAANTGFYMPFSKINNLEYISKNDFKITLPDQFKNLGYRANMFHMNKGSFYLRNQNCPHWGYDKYFGLLDVSSDVDKCELDRQLIEDETFYNNMFKAGSPFMHYITTYTVHTAFDYIGKAKLLADEKYGDNVSEVIKNFNPIDYAYLEAEETDNMVGKLLQALKDNGLYDNTVIVAYADHRLTRFVDNEAIQAKCAGNVNFANQTPFFIWSSDCTPQKIEKLNMQTDIMPTVLNMFGISFPKNYIFGHDIFDDSHPGFVIFPDQSFYDGTFWYKYDEVYEVDPTSHKTKLCNHGDQKFVDYIKTLIKKNDLTMSHNYFSQF